MSKAVRIRIHRCCEFDSQWSIFADFETPRCKFCTKMPEMSELCYLGKTRIPNLKPAFSTYCINYSFFMFTCYFKPTK